MKRPKRKRSLSPKINTGPLLPRIIRPICSPGPTNGGLRATVASIVEPRLLSPPPVDLDASGFGLEGVEYGAGVVPDVETGAGALAVAAGVFRYHVCGGGGGEEREDEGERREMHFVRGVGR